MSEDSRVLEKILKELKEQTKLLEAIEHNTGQAIP